MPWWKEVPFPFFTSTARDNELHELFMICRSTVLPWDSVRDAHWAADCFWDTMEMEFESDNEETAAEQVK